MIGADRQMKSVACAKIELCLVSKPDGRAEVFPRHGQHPKAFDTQAGEPRKRCGAMVYAESACPQLHCQRRSKLRRRPVADREFGRFLSSEPCLRKGGVRFVTMTDVST